MLQEACQRQNRGFKADSEAKLGKRVDKWGVYTPPSGEWSPHLMARKGIRPTPGEKGKRFFQEFERKAQGKTSGENERAIP